MLLPRFLTALVGAPILLLSIWWGQIPFFVLVFGVVMLALQEYYALAREANWPVSPRMGMACGAILVLCIALFGTRFDWASASASASLAASREAFFTPAVLTLLLLLNLAGALASSRKETAFVDFAVTWLGVFFVAWTLSHLFLIRDLRPGGDAYTFFLFIVVWTLDIGAYLGGKRFGKTKLSETVSPKKTWEGALIGSLSALVAAYICHLTFLKNVSVSQAMGLAVLVIVLAQVSDLSESLFKRNVQVKDSGRLLPGHGGILDRFDSFLLTAPVYYYAIVLFIIGK